MREWTEGPPPEPGIWWVRDVLSIEDGDAESPPWLALVYVSFEGDVACLKTTMMAIGEDYYEACPVTISVTDRPEMFVEHAPATPPKGGRR